MHIRPLPDLNMVRPGPLSPRRPGWRAALTAGIDIRSYTDLPDLPAARDFGPPWVTRLTNVTLRVGKQGWAEKVSAVATSSKLSTLAVQSGPRRHAHDAVTPAVSFTSTYAFESTKELCAYF